MHLFTLPWVWLTLLGLLPWLFTIWHIRSGEFPGRWERRRWFNTVTYLPVIGMWQYWTSGVHRRNLSHH
ncbi:hypothetical protein [Hymenobacter edaphi]|uniref:Uncharacterized protein n=1 Tax=Hymenobacter edaphi TaxID=2211146 RepID=A0A328BN70_9BACT|nr:hypothetical protein [Hymenobacter edaphi]RAK68029.1 hypothetical protein DLM85_08280 [Hymenobacter edaphi]